MLQVSVDKIFWSGSTETETNGGQVWDSNSISTVATDKVPSIHTTGSLIPQSSEEDNLLASSLLASNTDHDEAAFGSTRPVVQHHGVDSATAAKQNASLERAHSKYHHAQSSKLGTEQTHVSASVQPTGTLYKVTSKSNPQLSAVLQPIARPQADRDDLLIVMPSSIDRMPIVTASRGWRQGVRTYIALEEEIDLANASSIFRVRTTMHVKLPSSAYIAVLINVCMHHPSYKQSPCHS